MSKTAIISGVTGQDGAYLGKLLIDEGYKVIGLLRGYNPSSFYGLDYLDIRDKITLVECDLSDISQIVKILNEFQPDEIYNLAAQSSVSLSFQQPIGTFQFNTISVYNFLESVRMVNAGIKFYQASSSEMFGNANNLPLHEGSVLHPQSPYAISKAAAHWACISYRDSYNLFVCCGILFNHESFLRRENYFIKKIIRESIRISTGESEFLHVGNIDIKRDFGYAPKYVESMFLMMQKSEPDNYIVCSGTSVSLRSIVLYVFDKLEIPHSRLIIDQSLYRPLDIPDIYGNAEKARKGLGWNYTMSIFDLLDQLISEEINFKSKTKVNSGNERTGS